MKCIDVLLCLAVLLIVVFAVRSIVRARKNGKGCGGCSGDCASCGRPEAKDKTK